MASPEWRLTRVAWRRASVFSPDEIEEQLHIASPIPRYGPKGHYESGLEEWRLILRATEKEAVKGTPLRALVSRLRRRRKLPYHKNSPLFEHVRSLRAEATQSQHGRIEQGGHRVLLDGEDRLRLIRGKTRRKKKEK